MEKEPGEMVPVKIEEAAEDASVQSVVEKLSSQNSHIPTYINVKKEPEEMVPVKVENTAEEACEEVVVEEWSMETRPAPTDIDVKEELEGMVRVKTEDAAEVASTQVVVEKSSTKKRTCIDAENETAEMVPVKMAEAGVETACALSLPKKSKHKYDLKYQQFAKWRKKERIKDSNEDTLLAYYNELSKTYAPSSRWIFFSMLKSTLMLYENVDIQKYPRLQDLLKTNCKNHLSKKSKVFTAAEVEKFLTEAPDDVYLATKVASICEIWGGCRRTELVKMKIDHIKEEGRLLVVDVPDTEAKKARRFVIREHHAPTVKKYKALRPKNVETDRFFLSYRQGRCIEQVIGKHKFAAMRQDIARYLNIKDPENYTRRSKTKDGSILFIDMQKEPGNMVPVTMEEATEEACKEVVVEKLSTKKRRTSTCIDFKNEPGEMVPAKTAKVTEEKACTQSLPEKSKQNYESTYKKFAEWKKEKKIKDSTEDTLLAYYNELSKTYAPSSMWTFFSMLKSTMILYENVDIQKYARLQDLLKTKCKNHRRKKSKFFTAAEIEKFLTEAPDDVYLATKVASICEIWGACRRDELVNMRIDHIKEEGRLLVVVVPDTEAKKARRFVIPEDHVPTVKKYNALRPKNVETDRFFLSYRQGRCTKQVIGKHKFAAMPQDIARYLNIKDPENYTRHSKTKDCSISFIDMQKEPGNMVPVTIEESTEEACAQFVVEEWSMRTSPAPTHFDVEKEPEEVDPLMIDEAAEEACPQFVEEWSMKTSPAPTDIDVESEPEEVVPVKVENAAEEAWTQVFVETLSTKKRRASTCIDAKNEPGEKVPAKIANDAEEKACTQSLPEKSKQNYESTYKKFAEWKKENKIKDSTEDTLLAYYNELSRTYAPSSMWSFFSMLKSTIMLYENVDTQKYTRLQDLLKTNCKNYQTKKSKFLTTTEMKKFFTEAPDDVYLATKVASICEIWGACRRDELVNMRIDHIKEEGRLLVVDVPDTEAKKARRFVIPEDHVPTVKKYKALRPKNVDTNRFFLHYAKGRCTKQVIGKHKFAAMPQDIARYLNIKDPENYTRHPKIRNCSLNVTNYEW